MKYDIHLEKPIPDYAKAGLTILKENRLENGEYFYQINFNTDEEHDEFCELVYSILDINGSEESA
ncbi:MAG: hypothetical protein HRU19_24245 [Pseudobacteriovorax sp.]|nr:hypothetical protein [Pseudobacteriovorax sp.]